MNTRTILSHEAQTSVATFDHLANWYAGHKFPKYNCISWTEWEGTTVHPERITWMVLDGSCTQIGTVCFDRAAAGDGWSFTRVGEVRIPLDEV